ncbi:AMP-binding protein [Halovulum dunhuangense]|uniref:AMP-binding protein n=1 Tax=Halovulum dunhuangense TaxID=1505036 RepID=A0A849L3C9_9RHOB|nr:AMP-binding protein [Halovulum dunhuangense]NNU80730.1 AMP-binding protein [Halovulum dunhuangense]
MTTAEALSLVDAGAPPPCPAQFNLAAHTLAAARTTPDKIALEVIDAPGHVAGRWTFAEVDAAVRGTMTGLARAGLRPGDRLLLRIGHSMDFPILFFAATGMGALPVPTSPQLTAREVAVAAETVAPRLVALGDGLDAPPGLPVLRADAYRPFRDLPPADFADTRAGDPAYLVFTSGTGGSPKAVVHAHRAGWARRMMWADWYDLRPEDRLLHAGAFNWTFTLGTGLTDPWAAGATALIYAGPPDRGVFSAIAAAHGPTILAGAPGVFRQLLGSGTVTRQAFASLRHGLSAGDRLPERIRAEWREITGTDIHEALGMSEVSTYASDAPGRPGMRPQRGRRVAVLGEDGAPVPIREVGRLAVSGRDPGLMLGYWQGAGMAPNLPLEGEWFLTGDLAVMDAAGALTHRGRADDVMNAGGYRVSATEVEEVLTAHPGVAEAAVLALPVRADVEVIAAFVVPAEGASLSEDALAGHCAAGLARYKCPRMIKFLDALPRTPTGKVLKRRLRAEHSLTESP